MRKALLILISLFTFLSVSLKCENVEIKDTVAFKFKKNNRFIRFTKEPPFYSDWMITDTVTDPNFKLFAANLIPEKPDPKNPLILLNLFEFEMPLEMSQDRYSIRDYFDGLSEEIIYNNPDINIQQLYIDGMAKYPFILVKLEGYLIADYNKKVSSLWFGIRLSRKITFVCLILKGKKLDQKIETSYVNYFKDFEVIEE